MRRLGLIAMALALGGAAPFDPFSVARIDPRPGAQVPLDTVFTDQAGRRTTLRRIAAGKPMLIAPVLHNCPNLCGVTLAGLARGIAGQPFRPGRDMEVIALGIDPAETPRDAAADQARHRMNQAAFLTGTRPAIAQVTGALGFRFAFDPRIGQYAHVSAIAVLTPRGRLVRWLDGIEPDPADLARAIADAREQRTNRFAEAIAFLCYHYDPRTGRYSLAISRILQAVSILSILLLAFTILRLRRRRA